MIRVRLPASGRKVFAAALVVIVLYPLAAHFTLARAQSDTDGGEPAVSVSLPLQAGFFDGATALYITPEVGVDPNAPAAIIAAAKQVAEGFNSNFIPQNFGVLPGSTAVDDIFVFTNFAQGNVLASAPHPAGPANSDTNYSPLWHPGSPDARSRRHVSLSLSKSSGWTGRCHPQAVASSCESPVYSIQRLFRNSVVPSVKQHHTRAGKIRATKTRVLGQLPKLLAL